MGVYQDAGQGTLLGTRLFNYLRTNPNVLNEQDPVGGLTPLAAAALGGYADEVEQLLKKGAKADALSRDGETPLLLAAWKGEKNRARVIQLLLAKTPRRSVDATCPAAKNNTPLMWAIKNNDIESIRLLRKAGASLTVKNDDGKTAEDMANAPKDTAIIRALNPDEEPSIFAKLSAMVVTFLLFIVAWVNKAADGIVRLMFGLNPDLNQELDEKVNDSGEELSMTEFVKNVDSFIEDTPLERFFKDKDYIRKLAQKVTDLENDTSTSLGCKELRPKTIQVSLHQQVIYCDDSSSMRHQQRWESQNKLVKRITQITTRVLTEGEGVALRFINQDVENSSNLTLAQIGKILDPMSWKQGGDTQIGMNLKYKILQPLVYEKLESQSLERPFLITVITDGIPSRENESELANAILECGKKLEGAGYPRESVKFMVGQIGTSNGAARFLKTIRDNTEIAKVVYCTSDQLDKKFKDFRANEADLDRWLIETLFSPIQNRDVKED